METGVLLLRYRDRVGALEAELAEARERIAAMEKQSRMQNDLLAEAIIQLGGELHVHPIVHIEHDWTMASAGRDGEGNYLWKAWRGRAALAAHATGEGE